MAEEEEVQALVRDFDAATGQVTVQTVEGRLLNFKVTDVQLRGLSPRDFTKGTQLKVRHNYRGSVASVSPW